MSGDDRDGPGDPALGSVVVGLAPREPCVFRRGSARALHAALLHRIGEADPSLANLLHDEPAGAHSVERPWTVSAVQGPLERSAEGPVALPGRRYLARITALTVETLGAVERAIHGGAPLILDPVPFDLVEPDPRIVETFERRTTYRALLAEAGLHHRIALELLSPTAFRRARGRAATLEPRLALTSYLRRWNASAGPDLQLEPEPLLAFAERITVAELSLRERSMPLGRFTAYGHVGRTTWRCPAEPVHLLRQANALADYAFYCGTGMKTALGMGQTIRR